MIKVIPQRAASKASCRQGKKREKREKNEKKGKESEENSYKRVMNRMKIISNKKKHEKKLRVKNNKHRRNKK